MLGLHSGGGTGGENSPSSVATLSSAKIRGGKRDEDECGDDAGDEIMASIIGFRGC